MNFNSCENIGCPIKFVSLLTSLVFGETKIIVRGDFSNLTSFYFFIFIGQQWKKIFLKICIFRQYLNSSFFHYSLQNGRFAAILHFSFFHYSFQNGRFAPILHFSFINFSFPKDRRFATIIHFSFINYSFAIGVSVIPTEFSGFVVFYFTRVATRAYISLIATRFFCVFGKAELSGLEIFLAVH